MKIRFEILFILLLLVNYSCQKNRTKEILDLLNSNDQNQIIKGCSLIKDERDTIFIPTLFKDINDSRISHQAEFYGISVNEAKVKALKRISGLTPPNNITYKLDSTNITFYKEWSKKKGYFK